MGNFLKFYKKRCELCGSNVKNDFSGAKKLFMRVADDNPLKGLVLVLKIKIRS